MSANATNSLAHKVTRLFRRRIIRRSLICLCESLHSKRGDRCRSCARRFLLIRSNGRLCDHPSATRILRRTKSSESKINRTPSICPRFCGAWNFFCVDTDSMNRRQRLHDRTWKRRQILFGYFCFGDSSIKWNGRLGKRTLLHRTIIKRRKADRGEPNCQ